MKITRNNNRRTLVNADGKNGIRGILYNSSSCSELNPSDEIDEFVKKRNYNYRIFNNKKKYFTYANAVAEITNLAVRRLKMPPREYNDNQLKKDRDVTEVKPITLCKLIRDVKNEPKYRRINFISKNIDDALNILLCSRFNNSECKEGLKLLLNTALLTSNARFSKENYDTVRLFLNHLVDDYNQTVKKREIPLSIRNQNLVIQPDEYGKLVISDTPNSSIRKKQEKDAFREFLNRYASLDASKRTDLRNRLNNIIVLYIFGDKNFALNTDMRAEFISEENNQFFVEPIMKNKFFRGNICGEELDLEETKKRIREKSIANYRASLEYVECNENFFYSSDDLNRFWIHKIEHEIERIYSKLSRNDGDYKFKNEYLLKKIRQGIENYICSKYISIGKAVYHHAMEDTNLETDKLEFGVLDDKYINGVSSLEYERIKAEERLQRSCAVYLVFAVNYLARATVMLDEINTDFLMLKRKVSASEHEKGEKTITELVTPGTLRNILQFFGGISSWGNFFDGQDEIVFLDDLRKVLYSFRNMSFHFATIHKEFGWNTELIGKMFEAECTKLLKNETCKLASTCCKYYSENDLIHFFEAVNSNNRIKADVAISFDRLIKRDDIEELNKSYFSDLDESIVDSREWRRTVKKLWGKIYYQRFLYDEKTYGIFREIVDKMPYEDDYYSSQFKEMFDSLKDEKSIINTIKRILLECNARFNNVYSPRFRRGGYKKYEDILIKALRRTFFEYLEKNDDLFGFIKNPVDSQEVLLDDYEKDICSIGSKYDNLIRLVKDTPELQQWYIVGRFLSPKQINEFIVDIKSYVNYTEKIKDRAIAFNNTINDNYFDADFEHIIQILELCAELNGKATWYVIDYFDSDDEYALYLSKYLDFEIKDYESPNEALKRFCYQEIEGEPIGLYYDDKGPKINRSIILGKLFGACEMVDGLSEKIGLDTIKEYKKISTIRYGSNKKERSTIEEKNKWAQYEILRRIRDVSYNIELSEILYDLQGQLISWVYLRERDLMYFQLGFHYSCLNNKEDKPFGYDVVGNVKGAILYQIVAMYTYGLPLLNKNGIRGNKGNIQTAAKLGAFLEYTSEMCESKEAVYTAGLELFEKVEKHNVYIGLRNDIEHFHYFSNNQNKNMFDLYNEMYSSFMRYDDKIANNVPNVFCNILKKHQIIPSIKFYVVDNADNSSEYRFGLRNRNGLYSRDTRYSPLQNGFIPEELRIYYVKYLESVARLLYNNNMTIDKVWGFPSRKDKKLRKNKSKYN